MQEMDTIRLGDMQETDMIKFRDMQEQIWSGLEVWKNGYDKALRFCKNRGK